jgi:hypothetical protein
MKSSSRRHLGISRWSVLAALLLSLPAAADENAGPKLARYGNLPLTFEANAGQAEASVKFVSRAMAMACFSPSEVPCSACEAAGRSPRGASSLRMAFPGANPKARVLGLEELPSKANYLLGKDPRRWHSNVSTYGFRPSASVIPIHWCDSASSPKAGAGSFLLLRWEYQRTAPWGSPRCRRKPKRSQECLTSSGQVTPQPCSHRRCTAAMSRLASRSLRRQVTSRHESELQQRDGVTQRRQLGV